MLQVRRQGIVSVPMHDVTPESQLHNMLDETGCELLFAAAATLHRLAGNKSKGKRWPSTLVYWGHPVREAVQVRSHSNNAAAAVAGACISHLACCLHVQPQSCTAWPATDPRADGGPACLSTGAH